MKAQLIFTLPDEECEFRSAIDAPKWKLVVWEMLNDIRALLKYDDDFQDDGVYEKLDRVRRDAVERMLDAGLQLD